MHEPSSLSKRHRFPGEGISHAVSLYSRFLLRYRDVEELLAERGIAARYETIRRWCRKFGQTVADGARRRHAPSGDTWHLDEVQGKLTGRTHWRWQAVDQDGTVRDLLVQERRTQEAAEKQPRSSRDLPTSCPGFTGISATRGDPTRQRGGKAVDRRHAGYPDGQ